MGKFFSNLDEFFSMFIDDGAARFILCYVPSLIITYFFLWHLLANFGPFIIFGIVSCFIVPWAFAGVLFDIYKHNEERSFKRFKVAIPISFLILLSVVGIPYAYFGAFIKIISNKKVNDFYFTCIDYWWGFFNHLQPFKDKEIPWKMYEFNYAHLQIFLWAVSILVTGFIFYNLYQSDILKREELQKELEHQEQVEIAKEKALEQEKIRAENFRRRRLEEEQVRKLAQEAKEKKIQETKSENPWDSGFL